MSENNEKKVTSYSDVFGHTLFGRREIFADTNDINAGNVVSVLRQAVQTHDLNRAEIEYLYNYYKGKQPILDRKKEIRPDINNTIVENRANEIVSFKVGYLIGEPVQYVGRAEDDYADAIQRLNVYMSDVDKDFNDVELATWMHIAGVGYRMVLPETDKTRETPFKIFTLDPRDAFVVKYNDLGREPVMGVKFVESQSMPGQRIYSVYTKNRYFEISGDGILKNEPNPSGIPIVEYPLNQGRLGAFEIVLTQLDALNIIDSNRVDNVEQIVQAILLFHNVDVDPDDVEKLSAMGAVKYKDVDTSMKGEVKYITAELNQAGSQTLKNDIYESVLTICGMPNRNGGLSTSDTGSAVILRDGWSDAEARAKDTEKYFKRSEKSMLRLVLRACDDIAHLGLPLSSVDIKFTRRNYENGTSKANILTMMLANDKIAPRLAFVHSGMFTDPEAAYRESAEYYRQQQEAENGRNQAEPGNDSDNREALEEGQYSGDQDREVSARSS